MFCTHCGHELDSNNVCHNNSCPSKMDANQINQDFNHNTNFRYNLYNKINCNPNFVDKNGITFYEMAEFIGSSSTSFYIEKWTENQDNPHFVSWNWPAFFSSWVWLFYRKLNLLGCIYLVVYLLSLIFLPLSVFSVILFASNISCALLGNQMYIKHCTKKIKLLRFLPENMDKNVYFRRLRYSGGTSVAALIIGIITYVIATIFIIFNYVSDNYYSYAPNYSDPFSDYNHGNSKDPFSDYNDPDSNDSLFDDFDDDSDSPFNSTPHSSRPDISTSPSTNM